MEVGLIDDECFLLGAYFLVHATFLPSFLWCQHQPALVAWHGCVSARRRPESNASWSAAIQGTLWKLPFNACSYVIRKKSVFVVSIAVQKKKTYCDVAKVTRCKFVKSEISTLSLHLASGKKIGIFGKADGSFPDSCDAVISMKTPPVSHFQFRGSKKIWKKKLTPLWTASSQQHILACNSYIVEENKWKQKTPVSLVETHNKLAQPSADIFFQGASLDWIFFPDECTKKQKTSNPRFSIQVSYFFL